MGRRGPTPESDGNGPPIVHPDSPGNPAEAASLAEARRSAHRQSAPALARGGRRSVTISRHGEVEAGEDPLHVSAEEGQGTALFGW